MSAAIHVRKIVITNEFLRGDARAGPGTGACNGKPSAALMMSAATKYFEQNFHGWFRNGEKRESFLNQKFSLMRYSHNYFTGLLYNFFRVVENTYVPLCWGPMRVTAENYEQTRTQAGQLE